VNLLSLPLALALTAAAAPAENRTVVDRVAAIVNGDVVTLQEVARRAGPSYVQAQAQPAGAARDRATREALRKALDGIVADKLFEKQAKELDITVSDAMVDAQIDDIKKRNAFTDAELDQALQAEGLTRAAFRAQLKGQLQNFELLRQRIGNKVHTGDDDLRNYYQAHRGEFEGDDEVKARHIFLPVTPGASDAEVQRVQAEARRVLARLSAGEDFAKLARELSKGPNAQEGGDLGWIARGRIDPMLERAIFALKAGQVSEPVRAGPGIHLFLAEDRRKGGGKSFEEAKEEIRNRLLDEQGEAYRQQYIAELRRDAVIDVKLPELKQ
jgi:peptidyl-prolyl cis-trans isomerase SurA